MILDIQPVEGMVALQILSDAVDEDKAQDAMNSSAPDGDSYNEAVYAIVLGIGPKGPAGVKKGSTVLCRGYARNGLDLGDGAVLTDSYCIAALIK